MAEFKLPSKYDLEAQGPDGLMRALVSLREQARQPGFSPSPQIILYTHGDQKSFIHVDMTQSPYYFTYEDTRARPATNGVKETIARFLNVKELNESVFKDIGYNRDFRVRETLLGTSHISIAQASQSLFGGQASKAPTPDPRNESKYKK